MILQEKQLGNVKLGLKEQMELALELGLAQGKGAAALSRDVRQYLQYPDKLFRRVRDKDGILRLSKTAANFHPGQGVYRSSYKNALRLTVTENNMAYRAADYAQWNEMPFVIGMEIGLSNNHPIVDICDELKGVYPKEFKFVGWHPFCRCFAVPKLADRNELDKWARLTDGDKKKYTFNGTVNDLPKQFTSWAENNKGRIEKAKNLPYFIRDNKGIIERKSVSADIPTNAVASIDSELTKLAKAVGVEIGEPMTHERADLKHPNPHYDEDEQYRINCQSCVVAYELRRRGLPVEAFGNIGLSNGWRLSFNTNAAWLNAEGKLPVSMVFQQTVKNRTVDRRGTVRKIFTQEKEVWKEFYAKTSEVGRYHIKWGWLERNDGHIITMETFKDGTRRFYDPQTGKEATTILPWANRNGKVCIDLKAGVKAYRVDTLQPNSIIVRGVVKKAGSKLTTPKVDNEQRNIWFKINKNQKSINGKSNALHQLQKEIRRSGRFPITDKQFFANLVTSCIVNTGTSRKFFIDHCMSHEEILAAEYVWEKPQTLQFIRKEELGEVKDMSTEKAQKNINKKKKRGVVAYNLYKFTYKNKTWKVKLEVYKNGTEKFYSIVK